MSASQLAPGWTAILDENHQRYYYYDTKTGKTQWEMPTVQIPPPPPSIAQPQPTTQQQQQIPQTNGLGFKHESDASFPDLDDTLAATEEMLTKLNMGDNNSSSGGNFDYSNPRCEQRDSEDEEEEPYVLEEGVLDSGYDSDGNPINYENMEINFGDVYDDEDDGWIAAVNPIEAKGRQEMGSNPSHNNPGAKNGTVPAAKGPPPPASSSSAGAQNKQQGKAAAAAADKPTKPRTKFTNAQAPSSGPPYPNVHVAYDKGFNHDHVQCLITRDRSGITAKMYPTYELRLESTDTPMLLAKKMNLNRTSNYHLFDLTRGSASSKSMFTKNSGNFIGKLRARDMQRTEYVLLNAAATEREEIAGFMFDRVDVMTSITEGSQPRKLLIVIPPLDARGVPIPNRVAIGDEEIGSIINVLRYPGRTTGLHLLQTKEPTYINGNYRLNFRGRVKIPSVKNFQIVSVDNVDNILVQFGKIGDDRFHLDFKAPFNAMQAFALALSQFNL